MSSKVIFVAFLFTLLCLTSFTYAVPIETATEVSTDNLSDWTESPPHPFTKSKF